MGIKLEDPAARPLLTRHAGGDATRSYYRDAATRAVLEILTRAAWRTLLPLATGGDKAFVAVSLGVTSPSPAGSRPWH